jgi:transcriptional regulator with XRE-family HTH domain
MNTALINVLWLLWREGVEPERWGEELAKRTSFNPQETARMIEEEELADEVLQKIATQQQISEEEIRYGSLLSREDMLRENMKYLLLSLEHGEAKKLARKIGVAAETVSNWKKGRQLPSSRNRQLIKDYFGVPDSVDLEGEPLFLKQGGFSDEMRRKELKGLIETAGEETVLRYYEAIKKLLST